MQTSKNISTQSERSFDAWGRLRNPTNWSYTLGTTGVSTGKLSLTNRGFTGHEHLPSFGIINMNGRVYDPVVARFMSPDNYIQAPNNTQSFNRYSYAFNNPLKYIDPSGWEWTETTLELLNDMGGQWSGMANHIGETGNYKPNEDDTVSENDNEGGDGKKVSPLKDVPKGEKLFTLDEFASKNRGCTYNEIINQREPQQGMPGGPEMRYVINPNDNNVMDMRHVLYVGFKLGYTGGMLVEHVQWALGDPSKSAYHAQDYYSNYIGAAFSLHKDFVSFRNDFTTKFEYYAKNILPKFNNDVIRYAKQYGKDW